MKVYLAQTDISLFEFESNRAAVTRELAKVPVENKGLIILPELFSTGFMTSAEALQSLDSEALRKDDEAFLKRTAREKAAYVLGSTLGKGSGLYRNTSLLYSPEGKLIHTYIKSHPFSFGGEGAHFQKGNAFGVVELEGFSLQTTICYDLRFPELYRQGRSLGADLITVQANWPDKRHRHWQILLQARAIENQSWVIGVNRVGTLENLSYAGGSALISPKGEVLSEADNQAGITVGEIQKKRVEKWREAFPVWGDRREGAFYRDGLK